MLFILYFIFYTFRYNGAIQLLNKLSSLSGVWLSEPITLAAVPSSPHNDLQMEISRLEKIEERHYSELRKFSLGLIDSDFTFHQFLPSRNWKL